MTCLKYFLPISCVLLVGVCLWQLLTPSIVGTIWKFTAAFGSLGACAYVVAKVLTRPLSAPRGTLPGAWEGVMTPLMKKI